MNDATTETTPKPTKRRPRTGLWAQSAYDINEAHISGTVEHFRIVQTKTGTPMTMGRVRCWKEGVNIVAFNEVADIILNPGDRVEVFGKIQSTRWQTEDGEWRSGYQIVATRIIRLHLPAQTLDPYQTAASAFARPRKPDPPDRTRAERPGVMVAGENENLPF